MEFLPLYIKWQFTEDIDWNELAFGKAPMIVYLNTQDQLKKLEGHLQRKKINPCFPYPIYVISREEVVPNQVNILGDESEIPQYFNLVKKRLTHQENEIFYRINLLSEKIRNILQQDKLQDLTDNRNKTRKLFMISREAHYYETLLSSWEGIL